MGSVRVPACGPSLILSPLSALISLLVSALLSYLNKAKKIKVAYRGLSGTLWPSEP